MVPRVPVANPTIVFAAPCRPLIVHDFDLVQYLNAIDRLGYQHLRHLFKKKVWHTAMQE
jgi:hypothetical protein